MAGVMVAHHSPFFRSLLQTVVETEHAVVEQVTNGVEAVESCPTAEPDVAILGVTMPIQDGIEAAVSIREQDSSVGIVLCLNPDGDLRVEAASAADAVVVVPFRRPGVLEAVSIATG